MNRRRAIASVLLLACAGFVCGCEGAQRTGRGSSARVRPLVRLAGRSQAMVVRDLSLLPGGPGAEGRAGDLLLENAFVRFVVAAVRLDDALGAGGSLIDAAVQGGEDRMRLLVPLLGGPRAAFPVYESVKVSDPGGEGRPAEVLAEGHVGGRPEARVRTLYRLPPDSHALEVLTTVRNDGDSMLSLFGLRDMLYHGRTERYVPGLGFWPAGRRGGSRWLAFFWQGLVWGVIAGPADRIDGTYRPGCCELAYGTADIPPGKERSYRRFVKADVGGPERIWMDAHPVAEHMCAQMEAMVFEQGSRDPIAGARLEFRPVGYRSPFALVTDKAGRAQVELPAGRYSVTVQATGRVSAGPFIVSCAAGHRYRYPIPLCARAWANATVRVRVGAYPAPLAVRIASHSGGAPGGEWGGPAFPAPHALQPVLHGGIGRARVPLRLLTEAFPTAALLVASKGPLFSCDARPVQAVEGRTEPVELFLERVVDPGDYVAVDFRRHTDASLDCALMPEELALAGACEGLDGAVVCDPVFRTSLIGVPADSECLLAPGFRFERPGVGAFSFFPLAPPARVGEQDAGVSAGTAADLSPLLKPDQPPARVLAEARKLLPDALIQVDVPLDERTGYFALSGFAPSAGTNPPAELSEQFDAIELLHGRDVASARRLLPCWFALLNAGRQVIVTGGSGSGLRPGGARTFLHWPDSEPLDLPEAIRRLKEAPNAFVTNGPFISATLNGQPIGSRQTVTDGRARLRLRVYAPLWVSVDSATVYRNGQPVERLAVPASERPLRCDRVVDLDASSDCWFVVLVEGSRPMQPVYGGPDSPTPFAVTNPFWVDADGDGQVRVSPGAS